MALAADGVIVPAGTGRIVRQITSAPFLIRQHASTNYGNAAMNDTTGEYIVLNIIERRKADRRAVDRDDRLSTAAIWAGILIVGIILGKFVF